MNKSREEEKNKNKTLPFDQFLETIKKQVGELFNENKIKSAYQKSNGNIQKAINWLYTQDFDE